MNSVDFAKLASTYLKMPAQAAASAAEELYGKGIISYPRTETQIFDDSIDLQALVSLHAGHPLWGVVVQGMICPGGKFERPRKGEKHDNAHPPSGWCDSSAAGSLANRAYLLFSPPPFITVHPLKCITQQDVPDVQWKVYELITRHFLACCHLDARGSSTTLTVEMGGETFTASGTVVHELNFMDVYIYQVRSVVARFQRRVRVM